MATLDAAERGEATTSLSINPVPESLAESGNRSRDPSNGGESGVDISPATLVGWDGLVAATTGNRRLSYVRTFQSEAARVIQYQQTEIERLETKRQKLNAAALSKIGGDKPRYRCTRQERKVMKKMYKYLSNHVAFLVHYSALLDLEQPTGGLLDSFQDCRESAFRDGSNMWKSPELRDWCHLGPKQTILRKAIRRMPHNGVWRKLFKPAPTATVDMGPYNMECYNPRFFEVQEATIVVMFVAGFVLLPIVLVAFKVMSQAGLTLFLGMLFVLACVLAWIVDTGIEVLVVLVLAYASIICSLLQIATQMA